MLRWCVVRKAVPVLGNLCTENTSTGINYPAIHGYIWWCFKNHLKHASKLKARRLQQERRMKDASNILGRRGGFVFGLMSPVTENWERTENSSCTVTTFSNHANAAVMKITFSLSLFPMWCSPRFPALLPTFRWTKTGIFFKHLSCSRENRLPADCAIMHFLGHQLSLAVWHRVPAKAELEQSQGSAAPSSAAAQGLASNGERPQKAQQTSLSLFWSSSALVGSLCQQSSTEDLQIALWINHTEAEEVACSNVLPLFG